jgi:hypothetical protein
VFVCSQPRSRHSVDGPIPASNLEAVHVSYLRKAADSNTLSAAGRVGEVKSGFFRPLLNEADDNALLPVHSPCPPDQPIDEIEFLHNRRRKHEGVAVGLAHAALDAVQRDAEGHPGIEERLRVYGPKRALKRPSDYRDIQT